MSLKKVLTVTDHNRNVIGMKYVYPVVSRRAGGVSIGINLNINNACNWRCIYCNVPDLSRGAPDAIAMDVLEQELHSFLHEVTHGNFMEEYVDAADRQLKDIAFSGNGEPTSAKEFPQVLDLVASVLKEFNLLGKIKLRLITNGSLMDKSHVLATMKNLAAYNGEVWFKVDAGSKEGISRINDVTLNPDSHILRLINCAKVCPTFIQTCMFALDGMPPSEQDIQAYLALVNRVKDVIQGVHLYGLARLSLQPEASRLSRLSTEWLEMMGQRIRDFGVTVYVSP
jgi:wyosine [tRNA(Phe)-imidazoG37] synthetase (radical SAM superfamily)